MFRLFIFISLSLKVLFAYDVATDLKNQFIGQEIYFWDHYSSQCYGSQTTGNDVAIVVTLKNDSVTSSNDYNSGTFYYQNGTSHYYETVKSYQGILCAPDSSFDYDDTSGTYTIYHNVDTTFSDLNTNDYDYVLQRFVFVRTETITPDCIDLTGTTPDYLIMNGYDFQAVKDDISSCEVDYNNYGDGNGLTFVNPHDNTDTCLSGYCYYNLAPTCIDLISPSVTTLGGFEYQGIKGDSATCESESNTIGDGTGFAIDSPNADLSECPNVYCYYNLPDQSSGGDTGDTNTTNPDTTGDGEVTDLEQLIPYVDELETKNTEIINKLEQSNINTQNINDNLITTNTNLNNINSGIATSNTALTAINTNIQSLNDSIDTLNSQNSNDDYSSITSPTETDITGDLDNFTNDYESTLDTAYSNYSDVFGFGGYGSAPENVTLEIFGKSLTLLDISILEPIVPTIRNIFLICGYIFGLFLFFRGT